MAGLEHGDVEEVRIAPGGGRCRRAGPSDQFSDAREWNGQPTSREHAGTYEVELPARHLRQHGDYYADDTDDSGDRPTPGRTERRKQQPGASIHDLARICQRSTVATIDRRGSKRRSEDLKVGDFVRLHADESVSCGFRFRLVLSHLYAENGIALPLSVISSSVPRRKKRMSVSSRRKTSTERPTSNLALPCPKLTNLRYLDRYRQRSQVHHRAEAPDVNMFTYNAASRFKTVVSAKTERCSCAPVNLNTMLLRGTVVRNTEWVVGVVCMTGRDTKDRPQLGRNTSKRSKVSVDEPMVYVPFRLRRIPRR